MNILVIGISHKTSPVDIREQFYLNPVERRLLLSELKNTPAIIETIVLSTCNRTEIYATAIDSASFLILEHLFKIKKTPLTASWRRYFYEYHGEEAVRHLFKVSAGLDSLVLGEGQILGQVKAAVELSRQYGVVSKTMNLLSNLAIRAGKKAQAETQIGCGGSSVSWAAVVMAEQHCGSLSDKTVLIIGAGKMGHLAASQMKNRNIERIYVINRSREKAESLARDFHGTAVSFWDMKKVLMEVDVCICSAGAPHYLIDKELVEDVMRRRGRNLLFLDISTPRNIDPEVASVAGVDLMTIDNFDKVIEANVQRRYAAVSAVKEIVARKLDEFYRKLAKLSSLGEDLPLPIGPEGRTIAGRDLLGMGTEITRHAEK